MPNSDLADAKSQKSRSTAASHFMPDDCGLSGQFNVVKLKRTSDQRPTFTLKPDCFAKDLQISLTRCLSRLRQRLAYRLVQTVDRGCVGAISLIMLGRGASDEIAVALALMMA